MAAPLCVRTHWDAVDDWVLFSFSPCFFFFLSLLHPFLLLNVVSLPCLYFPLGVEERALGPGLQNNPTFTEAEVPWLHANLLFQALRQRGRQNGERWEEEKVVRSAPSNPRLDKVRVRGYLSGRRWSWRGGMKAGQGGGPRLVRLINRKGETGGRRGTRAGRTKGGFRRGGGCWRERLFDSAEQRPRYLSVSPSVRWLAGLSALFPVNHHAPAAFFLPFLRVLSSTVWPGTHMLQRREQTTER